jgi:WD40 repeat protein
MATGSGEGVVKLWDLDSFREVLALKGHTAVVHGVAFLPDGETLASLSIKELMIWHAPSLQRIDAREKDGKQP